MKLITISAAAVAAAMLAPGSALAVRSFTSTSGADYTWNHSSNTQLDIHDGEADSHDVAGEWVPQGTSSVSSATNIRGAYTTYTVTTSPMYKHRVVELVPVVNDDYGQWVYPY